VDHEDLRLPEIFRAARQAMAQFIETGTAVAACPSPDLDTLGARLFALLRAPPAPGHAPDWLLAACETVPGDTTCRLAVLVLAVASAPPAVALHYARQLRAKMPGLRPAAYAEVALLCAAGQAAAAEAVVTQWCATRPGDHAIRARLTRAHQPPVLWRALRDTVLDADACIDNALDFAGGAMEAG